MWQEEIKYSLDANLALNLLVQEWLCKRKGDTLAQRAVSLPHRRVRGKLVRVWWVSGSKQSQCAGVMMSIFDFNGTSGRGKLLRVLYRVGMELSREIGTPLQGREGKGYIAVPACRGSLAEAKRACNQTSPN
eukprot:1158566-Pelagomonas_calceolata.AAC.6